MWGNVGVGVATGAVLLFGAAEQASAAGVSVTSLKRLAFVANAGEANNVTISASGANVVVADSGAPLTARTGCTATNANQVTCPSVIRISAKLGDGDDHFRNTTAIPGNVQGGPGNDSIVGGAGNDLLLGEAGIDQIVAGAGNDVINVRGGVADTVDCGPGIDTLISDAFDHASATCERGSTSPPPPGTAPPPARPTTPLGVILPSPPGTPDPVKLSVRKGRCPTKFIGKAGGDRIDGTPSGDRMFGMLGGDVLNGLGGDDCLLGMTGDDRIYGGDGADILYGGSGRDLLVGGSGGDRLLGGRGRDVLLGGRSHDVLKGGGGRNRYRAGGGRDEIDARNRVRDIVDCGGGRDVARVDKVDKVKRCERLIVKR